MESPEEVLAFCSSSSSTGGGGGDGSNDCQYNSTTSTFTKRKRTKRLRAPPPPTQEEDYFSTTTTTTTTTTKEEEDTAHCLILLAQGGRRAFGDDNVDNKVAAKFGTSRKFAEAATTAAGAKAGFYVYECKTCSKCFPSFQALGGHRASHKKPKLAHPTEAAAAINKDNIDHHHRADAVGTNSFSNIKFRVHECSICGSEFSSGQALGGHMRRHRPGPGPAAAAAEEEKKKSVVALLSLDLNLPAPAEEINSNSGSNDDNDNSMAIVAFAFPADRRPMAAALVDCHY